MICGAIAIAALLLALWPWRVSRRDNVDRYYLLSTRWFGIFVHHIKQTDKSGVYHTHPWSWFSFVFGSYIDSRRWKINHYGVRVNQVTARSVSFFNRCPAGVAHRVAIQKPVWTLCFRGPRRCQWQVEDVAGNVIEIEPWTGTANPERTAYALVSSEKPPSSP